jgi:hypothetical protein
MHHSPTYFIFDTFTVWCEYVKYALGIKMQKFLDFDKVGWVYEQKNVYLCEQSDKVDKVGWVYEQSDLSSSI